MKMRPSDEKSAEQMEDMSDEEMAKQAIEACARDLIKAVHAQNVSAAAEAIQSAFTILDSMPHVEGPHESDNSFKQQNVKAAQEMK